MTTDGWARRRARRLTIAAALTLAACPLAGAPPARAETYTGVVRTLAADTVDRGAHPGAFAGRSEDVYRQVLVTGDRAYFLEGRELPANRRMRVSARLAGASTLDVSAASDPVVVAGPADSGTTRVLVLLAYWTAPDAVTPASAAAQMFSDTSAWYREASYGRLGQAGDVTPWLAIPAPATGCYADHLTLMAAAKRAAERRGYVLADYDNFVLYFPHCGGDASPYAGWSYVGAQNAWLNGYMDRRITVHEQGHNYGLSHGHAYLCSAGGLDGTCAFSEYGDLYDAMGASDLVGSFAAPQKALLGWLSGRTADLSAGGTATLPPLSAPGSGPRAAVVARPSGRRYWIEYRQPAGVDAGLPADATNGVLVHVTGPGSGSPDSGASLIDVRPSDGISAATATLHSGEAWTSPDGIAIRAGALTALGASVTVAFAPPGAPTGVTATRNDGARTATIAWRPPASSGASPVTGYRVERDGTDARGAGPAAVAVAASARSQTFKDLRPGATYTLSVRAVSAAGTGPAAAVRVTLAAAR